VVSQQTQMGKQVVQT